MMLTPRWPSAGTDRGTGIRLSGRNLQFDFADNFFRHFLGPFELVAFHLDELELDRGRPTKNADQNSELALIRLDLFDNAIEIGERPIDDLDVFARPRTAPAAWA